jgi:hypothetical protein
MRPDSRWASDPNADFATEWRLFGGSASGAHDQWLSAYSGAAYSAAASSAVSGSGIRVVGAGADSPGPRAPFAWPF